MHKGHMFPIFSTLHIPFGDYSSNRYVDNPVFPVDEAGGERFLILNAADFLFLRAYSSRSTIFSKKR